MEDLLLQWLHSYRTKFNKKFQLVITKAGAEIHVELFVEDKLLLRKSYLPELGVLPVREEELIRELTETVFHYGLEYFFNR